MIDSIPISIMGAEQSKSSSEKEMASLWPGRSLGFEYDDTEEDFVHVDGEKGAFDGKLHRSPEGLGIQLTYDWQTKLLEDPKNRYDILRAIICIYA